MDQLSVPSVSSCGRIKDLSVKVTAQMKKVTRSANSNNSSSVSPIATPSPASPFQSPAGHDPEEEEEVFVVYGGSVNLESSSSCSSSAERMAQQKAVEDCLNWIQEQQRSIDQIELEPSSKKLLDDNLTEMKRKARTILDYRPTFDRIKSSTNDQKEKDRLESAYSELLMASQQRTRCLENSTQILALEDLFGPLCQAFATTATSLVQDMNRQNGPVQNDSINTGATSQDCILANRDAWEHVAKQLKCAEVHLKNAADYQQFFYDTKEYQNWMPSDLRRAADMLKQIQPKGKTLQPEDVEKILSQLKTALTLVLHWKSKLEALTDRSRKVLPVPLRLQKLDYERPALSLADYKTSDTKIRDGEEVTLIDNCNKLHWKVRNARGEVSDIPSVQLVIQGPDPAATEAASKLRLQFLCDFTKLIKDGGKSLLGFLNKILKDQWSPEEEQMFKSLNPTKKQQIQQMLNSVLQIFSPVWDQFPAFQKLRQKIDKLKQILGDRASTPSLRTNGFGSDNSSHQNVLVSKTDSIDGVISNYKDWWQNWEQFKILTESSRHPEYLLAVNSSDQYKFLSPKDMKKRWQNSLLDFDETDFEETGDLETRTSTAEDEVYTIETAKEMAETSQLTTSEQEERQTFVITGVIDPRNDEQISLDRAVTLGIINQREGKYVNPQTGESMPIPTAMNAGKIKVEFTRTNKSAEKRSDLGLITIKTFREARPFTVKAVVDAKSEKQMTVDEAIKAGIMDQKKGIYINMNTKEQLSLADALDSGLLIVEFDNDAGDDKTTTNGNEPEYISKTYAIHAVIDTKTMSRKTFAEAVAAGLIDPQTGAYCNKSTGEYVYVGDAIKKGLIKATVVHDSNTLNIAPGNRVTLPDANLERFQQRAAPVSVSVSRSYHNGATTNGFSKGISNGSRY